MARFLKPLVRSGGYYPSRRWTPLVYPGGYTTANGGEEPAPPPIEKTITGNPIHILDALAKPAQALSVKLEPVQDLNGYDSPWPAGGGKNLLWLNNGIFKTGAFPNTTPRETTGVGTWVGMTSSNYLAANSIVSYTIGDNNLTVKSSANGYGVGFECKVTAGQKYTLSWVGINAYVGIAFYDSNGEYLSYVTSGASPKTFTVPESTANAIIVLRADNANVTGEFSNVQLEEGQTATAYSPYANICPISGWTGANVTRCGKNFAEIDSAWIGRSGTHNGITWRFNEDGSMTLDGTKTISTASVLIWNLANAARISGTQSDNKKHIPNGDYFIYSGHNKATLQVYGSNDENAGASNSYSIASGNLNPFRFTINDTYKYNWIRLNIGGGAVFDNYTFYPMVRLASDTGNEQAPYTGNTYDISWQSEAGTVYGGTLDVTAGKLTVQWGIVDLGTLRWLTHSQNFFYTAVSGKMPGTTNLICTNYKTKMRSLWAADELAISGNANTGQLYIRDMSLQGETGDEFKSAMSGVQLCYELATPIVYDLTPTQIELFAGENNIWSDGEMTLTYLADGNASDEEALNILLGGRYVNNHGEDEPTDREALNIILGENER